MSEAGGIYCRDCGYDLRATQSGPCPECGTVFSRSDYRTFARGQADVWPPYEFKFMLIAEGIIVSVVGGAAILANALRIDVATPFLAMGCCVVAGAVAFQLFLLVYGFIATIVGTRKVVPEKRLVYIMVMLSPWMTTFGYFAWIELFA